jgi:hypothetical protein
LAGKVVFKEGIVLLANDTQMYSLRGLVPPSPRTGGGTCQLVVPTIVQDLRVLRNSGQ